jgi:hypothetical protein
MLEVQMDELGNGKHMLTWNSNGHKRNTLVVFACEFEKKNSCKKIYAYTFVLLSLNMSKVLVVGATGWLGGKVIDNFEGTAHHLSAFVRPQSLETPEKAAAFNTLKERGVKLIPGELDKKEDLVAALQGMDVCICCLGAFQGTDQYPLIEALKEVGTIKRFIPSDFGMDYRKDPTDFDMTENVST